MLSWLQQNWLALFSLSISILALILSYKKFKHETQPALIVKHNEVENAGRVVVVGLVLKLVERTKRPSGNMHVAKMLRPGEKSPISASHWTKALEAELGRNPRSMEEIVLKLDGQSVQYDGARVASYLMSRGGNQIIILRFRAVEQAKTFVRLFSAVRNNEGRFVEMRPSFRLLSNRFGAFAVEKWYGKNAEIAPPFEFPSHE